MSPADVHPEPGPLGRLAGLAYRRRLRVVLAWVGALALTAGLSAAFAGSFFSLQQIHSATSETSLSASTRRAPEFGSPAGFLFCPECSRLPRLVACMATRRGSRWTHLRDIPRVCIFPARWIMCCRLFSAGSWIWVSSARLSQDLLRSQLY